jgi:hypothetical protein
MKQIAIALYVLVVVIFCGLLMFISSLQSIQIVINDNNTGVEQIKEDIAESLENQEIILNVFEDYGFELR